MKTRDGAGEPQRLNPFSGKTSLPSEGGPLRSAKAILCPSPVDAFELGELSPTPEDRTRTSPCPRPPENLPYSTLHPLPFPHPTPASYPDGSLPRLSPNPYAFQVVRESHSFPRESPQVPFPSLDPLSSLHFSRGVGFGSAFEYSPEIPRECVVQSNFFIDSVSPAPTRPPELVAKDRSFYGPNLSLFSLSPTPDRFQPYFFPHA